MTSRLYEVITAGRAAILGMFVERILGNDGASAPEGTRRSELIDHLPQFLDSLAEALDHATDGDATIDQRLSSAAEHGVQRLRLGFDVEAVVREYGVLRECILEAAKADGLVVSVAEFSMLAQRIDAGTAMAVTEFVAHKHAALENAVHAREAAIAVVSHDLRSPLNTIVLGAHRLASFLAPSSREMSMAEAIIRATDDMTRMIRDLLDLAAIDAGKVTTDLVVTPLHPLLESALASFHSRAEERGLTLSLDADAGLSCLCDAAHVRRVLANLLENAVKFTPPPGAIRIAARAVGKHARIEVSDTGVGISPDQLPHLFERFWRAPETARSGTGLGLHIARGLAEACGGEMNVESETGVGSTFWFTLPLAIREA
jgi:signal transduction histidine kinase